MGEKNRVQLVISSDTLTFLEIDNFLGIKCDEGWNKGERIGKSIIFKKHNGWALNSSADESDGLELHILNLKDRTESFSNLIMEKLDECSICVSCVSEFVAEEGAPALFFDSRIIEWLARFNASLDIDLYPT